MRKKFLILALVGFLALSGCSNISKKYSAGESKSVTLSGVTVSGSLGTVPMVTFGPDAAPVTDLQLKDIFVGTGDSVTATSTVTAHYAGYGMTTKQKFDSSWDRGQPSTFPLNQVILGWQQGLQGMKVGGRRLLVIPGELAYGQSPPPGIQPNETLVFVIDLQAI